MNLARNTVLGVVVVLAALMAAAPAQSKITSSSGQVQYIPAPPLVTFGALESDETLWAFDELGSDAFTLSRDLCIDITEPGVYDSRADLTPGCIAAGTPISTFMLHADPLGDNHPLKHFEGGITTDETIVGLSVLRKGLDQTDFLGAPGTQYPTKAFGRSLEFDHARQGDVVTLGAERDSVTVESDVGLHADQVRGYGIPGLVCKVTFKMLSVEVIAGSEPTAEELSISTSAFPAMMPVPQVHSVVVDDPGSVVVNKQFPRPLFVSIARFPMAATVHSAVTEDDPVEDEFGIAGLKRTLNCPDAVTAPVVVTGTGIDLAPAPVASGFQVQVNYLWEVKLL